MHHWLHWDSSIRTGVLVVLGSLLLIAACCGIVFWAWQGSVVGVLLSAMLPGFAAIWTFGRTGKAGSSPEDQP